MTAGSLEGCCVPYGEASRRCRDAATGRPTSKCSSRARFRKQLTGRRPLELRYEHRDELAHQIGVGRDLHEEGTGLFGDVRDPPRARSATRRWSLSASGILPGFSIGFSDRFTNWKRTGDGTVVRQNCVLHEVVAGARAGLRGGARHRAALARRSCWATSTSRKWTTSSWNGCEPSASRSRLASQNGTPHRGPAPAPRAPGGTPAPHGRTAAPRELRRRESPVANAVLQRSSTSARQRSENIDRSSTGQTRKSATPPTPSGS